MEPPRYGDVRSPSLIQLRDRSVNPCISRIYFLLCLIGLTFVSYGALETAAAEEVGGATTVIDGRTLNVAGRTVRLWGMDAPDLDQTCIWGQKEIPCGRLAHGAMKDLIIGTSIRCQRKSTESGAEFIAVCFGDSYDIGVNMIHTGWAVAEAPTSNVYRETEKKARSGKRGLWRGEFERPAQWRQRNKASN
ncbi:MAG: hypothetical protein CL731_04475 [Chloroflexi bacterium]|nr:hypothetical protein [Chloroflexota bacterium]